MSISSSASVVQLWCSSRSWYSFRRNAYVNGG